MSIRDYNKLYVHTDREEGSEKILLGYKNDLAEIVLKKDRETTFHIPLYTEKINVAESTLIQDGATAGPFPAASDRIFKNNKNYGATTPHGNTSDIANGVWFCSWLRKDENGNVQWMDRFYNPGYFRLNTARTQLLEYVPHNPVYQDLPSKLTLEQGVQYKYFHIGEKYAADIVTTYQGVTGERLHLNLTGWGTKTVDVCNNPKTVNITSDGPPQKIYDPILNSDKVTAKNLNFNNPYKTSVYIEHDPSYNFTDEFTLCFWAHSSNWFGTQSTQLVGNYTPTGGYGVFIDTLSSYPFFVIPETAYGHLLLVNEGFNCFLDVSTHPTAMLTATPSFVAINSNHEIITLEVDNFHRLKKLDHTGKVLKQVTLEATPAPLPIEMQDKIGSRWTSTGAPVNWIDIDASATGQIRTVITDDGNIMRSLDYGKTLSAVSFVANWTGIAVSERGNVQLATSTDKGVWRSMDYGATWYRSLAGTADWQSVDMSSTGQIQVIVSQSSGIYISKNYGFDWQKVLYQDTWKRVVISSEGKYFAALTDGQLVVSNDYGDTWLSKENIKSWSDVTMSDTGEIQTAVAKEGYIYTSADYGKTWSEGSIYGNWSSVDMTPTGRVQIAVADNKNGAYIYISFDYGKTWKLKQIIPQTSISYAHFNISVSDDGNSFTLIKQGSPVYTSTIDESKAEYTLIETPIQVLCGQHDSVVVITDKSRYFYDSDLNIQNVIAWNTSPSTVTAYAYDTERDTAELISVENVYDCKFIGTVCYCISATEDSTTNGNLWVKYSSTNTFEPYAVLSPDDAASSFGIDPFNRIWLMHGNNKISIYDTNSLPNTSPVQTFSIGSDISYAKKNISFMCIYDRETNSRAWRAIVYYGDSGANIDNPQVYILDMNGKLVRVIDILSLFDLHIVELLKQKQEKMNFLGSGDFTGYEFRRVFNNITPYKNTPQIVLRLALKDTSKQGTPFIHTKYYWPLDDWSFRQWQHFALTLKNRTFTLYNNSLPIINASYDGKSELDFQTQPSFFIGSPTGSRFGFNYEVGQTTAIFNGSLQDIKIYDYALEQKNLEMFLRSFNIAEDVHWTIPTPMMQHIETVERFFKNKIPGSKSSLFNIKLYGTHIKDPITRKIIEDGIKELVSKIKPAYTDLLRVKWID